MLYPPLETRPEVLWEAVKTAIDRHDDALHDFLDSPPQTNEVSRSSALLGMALRFAQRWKMPLALYEIGASAGLNLAFDKYRYRLGEDREWGKSDALVEIESQWRGTLPPLEAELEIVSRAGCDRNPLDPHEPQSVERLLAYIWPDQRERIERISAALMAAASMPYVVDRADAADWVEARLAEPPTEGVVRVFFHTIVWQYLSDDTKDRITAAFEAAGAAATEETPLVWMYMEAEDHPAGAVLKQTVWPGGQTETAGLSDYHGRWVDWFSFRLMPVCWSTHVTSVDFRPPLRQEKGNPANASKFLPRRRGVGGEGSSGPAQDIVSSAATTMISRAN